MNPNTFQVITSPDTRHSFLSLLDANSIAYLGIPTSWNRRDCLGNNRCIERHRRRPQWCRPWLLFFVNGFKARSSRNSLSPARAGDVIQIEGHSLEETTRLLDSAASLRVVDEQPNDKPQETPLSRDSSPSFSPVVSRTMNAVEYVAHLKQLYCSDQFFDRPIGIHSDRTMESPEFCVRRASRRQIEEEKRMMSEGRVPVDANSVKQQIETLLSDVLNSSPVLRRKINRLPAVAFLPTGSFDAFAQNAPDGEPICILDIKVTNDFAFFREHSPRGWKPRRKTISACRSSLLLCRAFR